MTRMRVVPWLRVVSAECNAQFIPDKIKERKKNSETSSLAFLCYTLAQLKKGIYRNSKIRDEVHADTAFLLMLLNKIELELKNGLLWKIVSGVVYKKDIWTPHMHNVVQNKMSS